MIPAKDELKHLTDCLSEKEAEAVLDLLVSVPAMVANCKLTKDDLTHAFVAGVAPVDAVRGINALACFIEKLVPCAKIYPRE